VQDVDVDLVPGEVLAVTGPSGSGKSTLLLTLAGLLPPVSGEVRLDGRPLADLDPTGLRRTVTLTAEDAHVFATTVRDNLLVARGDCTDVELLHALAVVGLAGWLQALREGLSTRIEAGTVSGGERRRLLLARALLVGSRVMLLDEPAEHLDAEGADALTAELRHHARSHGVAVVVVTHDDAAVAAADRVLALADGRARLVVPAPPR
jgi:ATP-binding cassette subfamily C protein CydC